MNLRDQLRAAIGTTDASEGLPHWHTVSDTLDGQPRYSVYVERDAVLAAIDAALSTPTAPALDVERLRHAKRNVERRNDRAFVWDRDIDTVSAEYAALSPAPTTEDEPR